MMQGRRLVTGGGGGEAGRVPFTGPEKLTTGLIWLVTGGRLGGVGQGGGRVGGRWGGGPYKPNNWSGGGPPEQCRSNEGAPLLLLGSLKT